MTISPAELEAQQLLTLEFIEADKKQITFTRSEKEPNGAGGFRLINPAALPSPQTMRLIPGTRQMPERQLPTGELVQPTHVLMGRWDADVKRWDLFTDQGYTYQVLWVHEKRAYQTKAEVFYLRTE